MSPPDPSKLARLGAMGLAGAAVLAATLAIGRQVTHAGAEPAASSRASLSAELDRCRAIGTAAQDDRLCMEAWRTSRDRFLDTTPTVRP